MNEVTATIRELRLDFRAVKRKIEAHGTIVITDNGVPSYVMRAVEREKKKAREMPDYYGRLLKQQPKALSTKATKELHEENRGER
jgi:hypothetical protein